MMPDRALREALERAMLGDANAMHAVSRADDSALREAVKQLGAPLVVTRIGAASNLRGLIEGRFSPSNVQAWASFMRRGFTEGCGDKPVQPIDVEFEEAWEEAISAAVSRLDELGDVIDGVVTNGEALDLLQLLGEEL